ncbi:permease-like cell division protein FtsX [Actinoplanes sp. NPDC000266]
MTEPSPLPPRRPLLIAVAVLIALAGILAGAAGGVGYLLYAGFEKPDVKAYKVTVWMKPEVTEAQKADIRAQLEQLPHQTGIEFTSSADSFADAKDLYKDRPEILEALTPEKMPQSFRLTTESATFDCGSLPSIRKLPGYSDLQVARTASRSEPPAMIACY